MRGQRTKWILGTDHAGIATQTQVERALEREGTSREQLGRDQFVQRVWEWRQQYGGTIVEQLKRLGCVVRLRRGAVHARRGLRAGGAEGVRRAAREGLHLPRPLHGQLGSRVRARRSPTSRSSRGEVTDTLYYIDYPLASGGGSITVATVRPETMLADTAIAVNPDDERYRRLIGEKAILPLVGRKLKIIADDYVKPEFGTGALKITPAHDPNDFEIGRRHGLAQPQVIGEDGRITSEAPERFVGLTVAEAQAAVVAELSEQGLIARTEPYDHDVPVLAALGRADRAADLAAVVHGDGGARQTGDRGGDQWPVRFFPENQTRVYLDWMHNIRPWCISRQLWWGHRLPGLVPREPRPTSARESPRGEGWTRDPDVLDTWFSSALWPFATLGWPDQTPELRAFYPDRRARHRPRHHLLVGRADDHDGARVHRPGAVRRRLRARRSSRRPTDAGCRSRSAPGSTRST